MAANRLQDVIRAVMNSRTATPGADMGAVLGMAPWSFSATAAENAAGVTPTSYVYSPFDSRRYSFDLTNTAATGVANAALLTAVLKAAGLAAASTLQPQEVVLYPGTYCITRSYINYSNVWLRILPGATLVQTLTGINNNSTTGQMPAYAALHVNPVAYTTNPGSPVTAIQNVRIYGGGTIQGPYTVNPGVYQPFAQGIVTNDCNKCWITGINMLGFGGENVNMGGSSWNTCFDQRINDNDVSQGGAVAFVNSRSSEVMRNCVHDSWLQDGVGGDGDQIVVGFNKIWNMAAGGLTPGGSGARDIGISRGVTFIGNVVSKTGLSIPGNFAMFCSDDGATTVPKQNHRYIGNTFDSHSGPIAFACDYNSGYNIEIENNTVSNTISPGGTGADFNVIAGSAVYHLRGNTFNQGSLGNNAFGITISSAGTPTVNIEEGNDISGHGTADINWSAPIVFKCEQSVPLTLTLTGFASGQNVPCAIVLHGNFVELNFTGTVATSTATTMTLGTLPAYLRPARNQSRLVVVQDNGANSIGIVQIATTGVLTFFKDINSSPFTNAGNKGLTGPYGITYLLT